MNMRSIDELGSLKPNSRPGAERLTYDGINTPLYDEGGELHIGLMNESIYESEAKIADLWNTVESGEGVEAEAAAHELARINLVKTAREIHKTGTDKLLWSERFRHASIELYGQPSVEEAAQLLKSMSVEFSEIEITNQNLAAQRDYLVSEYNSVLKRGGHVISASVIENQNTIIEDAKEFGQYITNEYKPVFDLVEEGRTYNAYEQKQVITEAIINLSNKEPKWNKVQVRLDDNAAHMSVGMKDPEDIHVSIGVNRPEASSEEMKGLLAHEVIWHLERGLNGWALNDPMMGAGFPYYEAFEEGGGIFAETGVSGEIPRKHKDRYLDIALALGILDNQPFSRQKLIELAEIRNLLVAYKDNNGSLSESDIVQTKKAAYSHVDRIYKGGIGDESDAGMAGVFTKDVIYYEGVIMMDKFSKLRKSKGISIEAMFGYLKLGKFNPLSEVQTKYVADHYGIKLAN